MYQHLFSPPAPLSSPLLPLLTAVRLGVLGKNRAERKNREEDGGRVATAYNRLPGDSIEHNQFIEAFIPLLECVSSPTPRIFFKANLHTVFY